jgi:D-tyrosyl-tRNA(Tyr) deacylase
LKAVIQRVLDAQVRVGETLKGAISSGLLAYLGVALDDDERDARWLAEKIAAIRLFEDADGRMNLSLKDIVNGQSNIVSQSSVSHANSDINKSNVNLDHGSINSILVNQTDSYVNKVFVNHDENIGNRVRNVDETLKSTPVIGVLAVSQFTLLGDARKGRRPSWAKAAPPEKAKALYEYCVAKIREQGLVCEIGEFQARMLVSYTNDGPVTILLDSKSAAGRN